MKGLTHFISGVAAASFIRAAVTGAAEDGSFALVAAGIGGILPDTLDFKLAQFIAPKHVEAEVDPADPRPEVVAQAVRDAVEKALESGREIQAHFHTVRLSSDRWRQYFIELDEKENSATVRIGPRVDGSACRKDDGPDPFEGRKATIPLGIPIRYAYDRETPVDIFNGPRFGFRKNADGMVEISFLPWHRRWSHSLTAGALFGALVLVAFGPLLGLCAGLGWFVHVMEDQLGHMGSNLFYPFTKRRLEGLKLMRSGDALPNFLFVWLSVALVFWNLNRFNTNPPIDPSFLSGFIPYVALVFAGPLAILLAARHALGRIESRAANAPPAAAGEASSEMDENFSG